MVISKGVRIESPDKYANEQLSLKNNDKPKLVIDENFIIEDVPILLQRDYGKDNDCTITSITTVMSYLTKSNDFDKVYDKVIANISPKWAYGWYGTIPIFITKVINNVLNKFGYTNKKSSGLYFKRVGVTDTSIKKWLKNTNIPLILSIYKANDGYYKYHSITVVGFIEYLDKNTGNKLNLFAVHDNWSKKVRYLDYNKLHLLCMLNYIK